jgi:hypothetical protein
MKKSLIFFLVLPLVFQPCLAQNYQAIKPDRIAYFEDGYHDIECVRIDSVSGQTDTIYYPFSNIDLVDDNSCYIPDGPSWIGKKIIARKDGYDLFFNRNKDTIKLKTNARLHEKWIAFDNAGSEIFGAEVSSIDTLSFLGLSDSVKTIKFQVYDASMVPIDHSLNDMTLLLSKNFGFIRTFNFNLFPGLIGRHGFQSYDLAGLSKPGTGVQNITWFDVFDFQPGDELHEYYRDYDPDGEVIRNKILKYLERNDFVDSIIYRIELTQSVMNRKWLDSSTTDYSKDTVITRIKRYPFFDRLPGEPIVSENTLFFFSMTNYDFLSKVSPSYSEIFHFNRDSCWVNPSIDGCDPSYYYMKGLGGPYYQCDYPWSIGGREDKLVYYKKGQVSWGVPLVITEIPDVPSQPVITVFPNPTGDKVWISAPATEFPFVFELLSLNGQLLKQSKIHSPATAFDAGKYGQGTYLYRLKNSRGKMTYGKLVIE